MNGATMPISWGVMVQLAGFRPYVVSLGTLALLMALADAHVLRSPVDGPIARGVFWFGLVGSVFALWGIQSATLHFLASRMKRSLEIRSYVLHVFPILGTMGALHALSLYRAGDGSDGTAQTLLLDMAQLYAIALVFEFHVLQAIEPFWTEHYRASIKPPADSPGMPTDIRVPGGALPTAGLCFLKSVEHYVEFHKSDGSYEMHRLALRKVVDLMRAQDGIQPHRSYWVFRHAIAGVDRQGGSWFLTLPDGTEIPIARSRVVEVRKWLNDWTDCT